MGAPGANVGKMMRGQANAARASRDHANNLRSRREGRGSRYSVAPARTPASATCETCGAKEAEVPLITTESGFQCLPCEAVAELEAEVAQAQTIGAGTAWAWAILCAVWGLPVWWMYLNELAALLGLTATPWRLSGAVLPPQDVVAVLLTLWLISSVFWWSVGGYAFLTGLRELGRWVRPAPSAMRARRQRILHGLGALAAMVVGFCTLSAPFVLAFFSS